jgi:hypothetical protein
MATAEKFISRRPPFLPFSLPGRAVVAARPPRFFWPVILTLIPCILINFSAFRNLLAYPVLLGLPFVALWNPYSGLLYLTTTQFIPDISLTFPLTNCMVAVAAWCLIVPCKKLLYSQSLELKIPRPLLFWLAPFLWWLVVCAMIHGDFSTVDTVVKSALVGVIAWHLIRESRGKHDLCFLAILIGCLPALIGYWGQFLGIQLYFDPNLASSMVATSRGGTRVAMGRGDVNNSYPFMISAMVGFLAMSVEQENFPNLKRFGGLMAVLAVAVIFLGMPATIATMSRGALVCVAGGLVCIGLYTALHLSNWRSSLLSKKLLILCLILGMGLTVLMRSQVADETLYRSTGLVQYWQKSGLTAGRENVNTNGLLAIWSSPLIGMSVAEYMSRFTAGTYTIAHNAFLDVGIAGGVPGVLFCLLFFLAPLAGIFKKWKIIPQMFPMLVVYVTWLIFMIIISSLSYKIIWLLWALIISQQELFIRRNSRID